jgi:hypothetical protein
MLNKAIAKRAHTVLSRAGQLPADGPFAMTETGSKKECTRRDLGPLFGSI